MFDRYFNLKIEFYDFFILNLSLLDKENTKEVLNTSSTLP